MSNFDSKFDINRARRDTRACEDIIHFNNAGSSLMPAPVADALAEFLRKEEYNGGYETAAQEAGALDNFYFSAEDFTFFWHSEKR